MNGLFGLVDRQDVVKSKSCFSNSVKRFVADASNSGESQKRQFFCSVPFPRARTGSLESFALAISMHFLPHPYTETG